MIAQRIPERVELRYFPRPRTTIEVVGQALVYFGALTAIGAFRPDPAGLQPSALQHTWDIIRLEQRLHIFREVTLQKFFLQHGALEQAANAFYTVGYYPLLGISAIWLFWRNRDHYRLFRNTYLFTLLIGYIIFLLHPVAPPRYFPELGFHDTLAKEGEAIHFAKNPFAAVPSLHFATALLAGGSIAWTARPRVIRILAGLMPAFMLTSIVATGNHFFADAIAAVPVLGAALLAGLGVEKWRNRRSIKRAAKGAASP